MTVYYNNSRFDLRLQYYLTEIAGDSIQHYKAMPCTCSRDPNRAQPGCLACYGTGRAHMAARTVRGLLTMAQQHKDLAAQGMLLAGDLVFSPEMHDTDFADFDMVRIAYAEGASWPGETWVRMADTQRLYYPVKTLYQVSQFDPDTGARTDYVSGTDFTISGRLLTWMADKGPAIGTPFSLRYKAQFEWLVQVPPAPRFEMGTPLGMRVVLRLRHLVNMAEPL